MFDFDNNINFLGALYRGTDTGLVAIWQKGAREDTWFPVGASRAATEHMLETAADRDIYFRWCLQDEAAAANGCGRAATAIASPGFMLDVDLKGPAHRQTELPKSAEEIIDLLEDLGLPKPASVRDSGNGRYLDYLFDKIAHFPTEKSRADFASQAKRFSEAFLAICREQQGWVLDPVADLARLTRLPGTANHKLGFAQPVTQVSFNDTRRIDVAELEDLVRLFESKVQRPAKTNLLPKRNLGASSFRDQNGTEDFGAIVSGCAWLESVLARAEGIPEPEWYAAAGIAARCANGENGGEKVGHGSGGMIPRRSA